jgi:valyl-tRNA synthetase
VGADAHTIGLAKAWEAEIIRLARLAGLSAADSVPKGAAQIVLGETIAALPLEGVIDFAAERARLGKELEKADKDIAGIDSRLGNPGFVAKAPEEVIEEAKERKETLAARRVKILEALERLGA